MLRVFNNLKPGFENEVFVMTAAAYPFTLKLLDVLREKVLDPDRKYIKLTPMKKREFIETEFKVIAKFTDRSSEETEDDTFRGRNVHVFTGMRQEGPDICASVDLWEYFLTLDCLFQSGAKSITSYYLYQIGQRQHKNMPHQPFTAALSLRLAQTAAGGSHILRNALIVHSHNETSSGFLSGTKVDNYLPLAPAVIILNNHPLTKGKKIVTVATDAGSATINRYLANVLKAKGPIILNKDRDDLAGPESYISAGHQFIDPDPDTVYVSAEDIVSSGETVENAKSSIEEVVGHPIKFIVFATNACLKPNKQGIPIETRMPKNGIHVIVSNTMRWSDKYIKKNSHWCTFYSLVYFIADLVVCNVLHKSTSVIMNRHLANAQKHNFPKFKNLILSDINKIDVKAFNKIGIKEK